MKKLLIFLILFSCNSKPNKSAKLELPIICIEEIGYHEERYSPSPPAIFFTCKITDSIISKKMEKSELTQVFLYSMGKEDQRSVGYNIRDKVYKKGNSFSFFIRTAVFAIDQDKRFKKWKDEEIKKILDGDVGLVFRQDTIRIKGCTNKKIVIDRNIAERKF